MSYTSRETSPDPLAGPSSPMPSRYSLADKSDNVAARPRRSSRPLASRSHNIASPSKSFIMDTGPAGDASPWRIKVTVEAEPKDEGTPSKRVTRTTKVPLKGSSSPVKKSPKKKQLLFGGDSEAEIKRPQRKRKGTPIRRNVKRASPERDLEDEDAEVDVQVTGRIEMSGRLQEELSSPMKGPVTRARRKCTPKPSPAERARRLSKAQAQLEALGDSDDDEEDDDGAEVLQSDLVAGDMTVANEDFTMISVATLESMKQGNTSQLLDQSGIGEKSAVSGSYMPSSPPRPLQVHDDTSLQDVHVEENESETMSRHVEQDQNAADRYDMSWKPTGPLKTPSLLAKTKTITTEYQPSPEPTEYRLHREAVSREIENASASQVIVIDSSHSSLSSSRSIEEDDEQAVMGAQQPADEDVPVAGDDDIWAEEASRSLEDEQQGGPQQAQQSSTAAALNELFSDQASKPPRGKIPRTWRRTSGIDFSYVDSPEHGALKRPTTETRKVSATSTGTSQDGVLTPPESSFDEDDDDAEGGANVDELDVDLTHPDAAATQLEVHGQEPIPRRREDSTFITRDRATRRDRSRAGNISQASVNDYSASNSLTSNGSTRSNARNEEEDTGMFWQTNLPNVYRQERRKQWGSKLLQERRNRNKKYDLSEILKSSSNLEEDQKPKESIFAVEKSTSSVSESTTKSKLMHETKQSEKVVNSPLRKSLLRSSKIGGSAVHAPTRLTNKLKDMQMHGPSREVDVIRNEVETSLGDSFDSKASDERQLLAEMKIESTRRHIEVQSTHDDEGELSQDLFIDEAEAHPMSEATYDGQSPASQARFTDRDQQQGSYDEENGEPTEKNGHWDEHTSHEQSAHSYEERLNLDSPMKIRVKFNDSEGNSSLLAPTKTYRPLFVNENQPAQSLTSQVQLISAPVAPAEQEPGLISRLGTTIWSALIRPSGPTMVDPTPEPEISPFLRSSIRSRYGVLSDQLPWTMAHMRTLHRLLNSSLSNRADSLVPKSGPPPAPLRSLIGKHMQCVTEFRWTFTEQHAHVVDAFMQTLVPAHYIDSIRTGEVAPLGDDFALTCRGEWAGRHGDDLVWDEETVASYSYLRKNMSGTIDRSFVVRALGNAVSANIETTEREVKEKEERERIEVERRAWERKMGVVHDEDEDE